jgi:hypothetical protein
VLTGDVFVMVEVRDDDGEPSAALTRDLTEAILSEGSGLLATSDLDCDELAVVAPVEFGAIDVAMSFPGTTFIDDFSLTTEGCSLTFDTGLDGEIQVAPADQWEPWLAAEQGSLFTVRYTSLEVAGHRAFDDGETLIVEDDPAHPLRVTSEGRRPRPRSGRGPTVARRTGAVLTRCPDDPAPRCRGSRAVNSGTGAYFCKRAGAGWRGRNRQQEAPPCPIPTSSTHCRCFSGCDDTDLAIAGRLLTAIDASPGRVLMVQGGLARQFVIVESGQVEVVHHQPDGSDHVVTLGADDWVGEVGLIDHVPSTATVRTRTGARVHVAGTAEFRQLLEILPIACQLRSTADDRVAENQLADAS